MARRRSRRRRRRIFPKIAGAFCVLLLMGVLAAAGGHLRLERMRTAETVSLTGEQQVEFPELTVTAEEVAGDFYYQQLSEAEQTVYREILQGVTGMEETIRIHAGKQDDAGRIYEYLLYDRPELFWCDGTSRMTIYEDYTEMSPGYTCTASEKDARQAQTGPHTALMTMTAATASTAARSFKGTLWVNSFPRKFKNFMISSPRC